MPFEVQGFRAEFPALTSGSILYFDNAATTQRPKSVVERESNSALSPAANPGRSTYPLATEVLDEIENARTQLVYFLGGESGRELVYTSGATQSLNFFALSWGLSQLRSGDQILFCPFDHHSLTAPWFHVRELLALRNIDVELVPYRLRPSGEVDLEDLAVKCGPRVRLLNITHIHNAAGTVNDLRKIRDVIGDRVVMNADIAQSFGHVPLRVHTLGIDVASFSGHKCFAATGIGGLWIHPRLHNELTSVFVGGGQMEHAAEQNRTPAQTLEAGTLNVSGIRSLAAVCEFLKARREEGFFLSLQELAVKLYEGLLRHRTIEPLYPVKPYQLERKTALASFRVPQMNPMEVADFLAQQQIFVRAGNFCTGRSVEQQVSAVRASLHAYNTADEIDHFFDVLSFLNRATGHFAQ